MFWNGPYKRSKNDKLDCSLHGILQIRNQIWKTWCFYWSDLTLTRRWTCTGIGSYNCWWRSKYIIGVGCDMGYLIGLLGGISLGQEYGTVQGFSVIVVDDEVNMSKSE